MKNGKKPTVAQRKFMKMHVKDTSKWLVAKDTPNEMELVSRNVIGKPKHNQIKTLTK